MPSEVITLGMGGAAVRFETVIIGVRGDQGPSGSTGSAGPSGSLTNQLLEWEEDIEVTIDSGGVAQEAVAANPNRALLMILADPDNAEPGYYSLGGDAAVGVGPELNFAVPYNSHFPLSPSDLLAVSLISATAGSKFIIRQKVFPT